jgi:hypothetical protein
MLPQKPLSEIPSRTTEQVFLSAPAPGSPGRTSRSFAEMGFCSRATRFSLAFAILASTAESAEYSGSRAGYRFRIPSVCMPRGVDRVTQTDLLNSQLVVLAHCADCRRSRHDEARITGRAKDMTICGSKNISMREIDEFRPRGPRFPLENPVSLNLVPLTVPQTFRRNEHIAGS